MKFKEREIVSESSLEEDAMAQKAKITVKRAQEIALMIQRHHLESVGTEQYMDDLRVVATELSLADDEMVGFIMFVGISRNHNGKSIQVCL